MTTQKSLPTLQKGFTIVELMIVIVVIAILATISTVSYTNIQNRARDTTNKVDVQTIVRVAEMVYSETGAFPTGANSAALRTSFDQSDIAKLPGSVTVSHLASSGTNPTNAQAVTEADKPTRTYIVKVCSAGLIVFYPNRASAPGAGTVQTMTVGTTASATSCT